jgi:hypothetical protein
LVAKPGSFAVLAGAGISSSSGIPTGEDLIRLWAARAGQDAGPCPVDWYRQAYGSRPNYIRMLHELAGASAIGAALPPALSVANARPTPAQRSLARLVAGGYLGPILTTNFDRLLEQALREAGVDCAVAADLAAMDALRAGRFPAGAVVKLHGDCADISIRDTSAGTDTYHKVIDYILDSVLSRFDLIVCGWSATWDVALQRALARAGNRRPTFWLLKGIASTEAGDLIRIRGAQVIPVRSSDAGLTELAVAVAHCAPGQGRTFSTR